MSNKKGKVIQEPLCKRCQRYLMTMSVAGEYICSRCGYIGEPTWISIQDDEENKDGKR